MPRTLLPTGKRGAEPDDVAYGFYRFMRGDAVVFGRREIGAERFGDERKRGERHVNSLDGGVAVANPQCTYR